MINKYYKISFVLLIVLLVSAIVFIGSYYLGLYSGIDKMLGDLTTVVWENEEIKNVEIDGRPMYAFMKDLYVSFGILGGLVKILFSLLLTMSILWAVHCIIIKKNHNKENSGDGLPPQI